MAAWPFVVAAGAVVGILSGLFGVGGSSFATPALALLGVKGLFAVASPLPATIPTAFAGLRAYRRSGELEPTVARWSMMGGVPAAVAGALLSKVVGGEALVVASGVVVGAVGVRVLRPVSVRDLAAGASRRSSASFVIGSAVAVGLFTGLLANGGGFLLVPLFLVVFGLPMRTAAGTSLVVVAALAVPTLATHWMLGNIDWAVALGFGAGSVPGAWVGSRLAHKIHAESLRVAFGMLLVAFSVFFLATRVL